MTIEVSKASTYSFSENKCLLFVYSKGRGGLMEVSIVLYTNFTLKHSNDEN